LWVMVIAFVSVGSIATAWTAQFYQSHWQRSMLLNIRNVINVGIARALMREHALATLEAYHDPARPKTESFVDVFNKLNPRWPSHPNILIDSTILKTMDEKRWTFENLQEYISASCIGDSMVQLRFIDVLAQKQDSVFKALKLNLGYSKPAMDLSAKGAKYVPEY